MTTHISLLSCAIFIMDVYTSLRGFSGLLPIGLANTRVGKVSACFTNLVMYGPSFDCKKVSTMLPFHGVGKTTVLSGFKTFFRGLSSMGIVFKGEGHQPPETLRRVGTTSHSFVLMTLRNCGPLPPPTFSNGPPLASRRLSHDSWPRTRALHMSPPQLLMVD